MTDAAPSVDAALSDLVHLHALAVSLGLNPRLASRKARAGEIPARKIGRDWVVSTQVADALRSWAATRTPTGAWPRFSR